MKMDIDRYFCKRLLLLHHQRESFAMLDFEAQNLKLAAHARNKEEAIAQVAAILEATGAVAAGYAASMAAREQLANTYLGSGIAIPHGLPEDRDRILRTSVAILQLPAGVEWQPGVKAHLVIGIAARSDEHLELLGRITGLLSDEAQLAHLAQTTDANELLAAFRGESDASEGPAPLPATALRIAATVGPDHGLHARPATVFSALARSFISAIQVEVKGKRADGKSMASLLLLGAAHQAEVTILGDGPDAAAALTALKAQIEAPEIAASPARRKAESHGWKPESDARFLKGISMAPGLAIGRIHRLGAEQIETAAPTDNPREEKRQLAEALAAELAALAADVKKRGAADASAIFAAQAEILDDAELLARVYRAIETLPSASYVWKQETDRLAERLANSGNAITSARANDVRDAASRVLRCLLSRGRAATARQDDELQLLVAENLTPSDAAALDKSQVAGFCTAEGSATSHVAILARSLNIPAILGIDWQSPELEEGDLVILDADSGHLYLSPTDGELKSAREALARLADRQAIVHSRRFQPAITEDGLRIEVCANIGKLAEVSAAVEAGAEGSGLLRSEFLFLDRSEAPTEEEQFDCYRQMLQNFGGLPLVLRTLDIGGDKPVPYIAQAAEENPFLGVRGIRLCFRQPELFRTQLRAAYRAAEFGDLRLMFPMISGPEDFRRAKAIAEEVRLSVGARVIEIGTMIEVPSAVLLADELIREADFFSIGTNDLTQYVLAMDRGNAQLAAEAHGLHPAVLRMIERTASAANRAGKWAGVCGGLAGEPAGAVLLAGLGIRELSVATPAIAAIKQAIRSTTRAEAEALAQRALRCDSLAAVRQLLEGLF